MTKPPSTRDRLLTHALRLFGERGYAGTHVTDIEAAAGLTPGSGSFYRHFKSKEEVFEAVLGWEMGRLVLLMPAGGEAPPDVADPNAAAADWVERGLDGLASLQPLIAVLAREHGRFPELFERLRKVSLDLGLEALAEQVQQRMGGSREDAVATATVVMSALVGFHLTAAFFETHPAGVSREAFARILARLVPGPGATG